MIESYDFGHIVVDGVTYTTDVLIMGDKVQDKWWRQDGHTLHVSHMRNVLSQHRPPFLLHPSSFSVGLNAALTYRA